VEAICQVHFQVDYQVQQKRFTLEEGVHINHKLTYVISFRVCCSIVLVSETHPNKIALKCCYPKKKKLRKKLSSRHKMSRIQNLSHLLKSDGGSGNPKFFPGSIFPKLYESLLAENMPILTTVDMLH
jgi:hypothetical protein